MFRAQLCNPPLFFLNLSLVLPCHPIWGFCLCSLSICSWVPLPPYSESSESLNTSECQPSEKPCNLSENCQFKASITFSGGSWGRNGMGSCRVTTCGSQRLQPFLRDSRLLPSARLGELQLVQFAPDNERVVPHCSQKWRLHFPCSFLDTQKLT